MESMMDVLEWALWSDASDDEAPEYQPGRSPRPRKRRSPIRPRDALSPALLVKMKLPNATDTGTPKAKPIKPESARTTLRRRKSEIARLRVAADYLEKCLAQLKDQRPADNESTNSREGRRTSALRASCEFDQLQQSQEENNRLREQLRDKLALARELEELVSAHHEELHSHFSTNSVPASPFLKSPREVNPEVLEGLLHTLDAMYLQTDDVFADARYSSASPIFTDVDVQRQLDPDLIAVEVQDSRIVPFDVKSTAKAVWQNVLGRSVRPQSGWVENLPNETLRSHFVAYMKISGMEDHVRCIMALRRIVEETRVVMVRCSILTHSHPRHRRPMNSRLLAWVVVGKPLHPALRSRERIAQVQHCSVIVPTLPEEDSEEDTAAITKVFAAMSRHVVTDSHGEVDSYLLRNSTCC